MAAVKPPDRCPGVLRPHLAADGALIRIRVPGGQTTGAALARLGEVSRRHGSGLLQLTSRGGIQVRGLPAELPDAVADDLADAGFLPSADHERVRNIAASPLTGLVGGRADLRPMVAAFDAALIAEPELVDLPGRFLFVLDDGRGDVGDLAVDLGYRALDHDHGVLLIGAGDRGRPVAATEVVPTLIALARRFLTVREGQWHVRDLDAPLTADLEPVDRPSAVNHPLGRVGDHASVAVPLGLLAPEALEVVTRIVGAGPVVVTPWRGLVLPDAADRLDDLRAAGLVVDDDSAWTLVTACVGAPWCGNGRVDTQDWARTVVAGAPTARTHISGCERRCGAPVRSHVDLVAHG